MALVKITDQELAYALWQNGMLCNSEGLPWAAYEEFCNMDAYRSAYTDVFKQKCRMGCARTYIED